MFDIIIFFPAKPFLKMLVSPNRSIILNYGQISHILSCFFFDKLFLAFTLKKKPIKNTIFLVWEICHRLICLMTRAVKSHYYVCGRETDQKKP